MYLQRVLNRDLDTIVAQFGDGSANYETTYFGPATRAAVIKFQKKYGISPAAGYVGAITRAKLNEIK
jgi:peptidoglycan hydrolase-like protein with peptidoglycan-binding domain